MRIYMLMTVLAPLGGIEAALVPLACTLKAKGHEVTVYTIEPVSYPNQNAEVLSRAGIELLNASSWLVHLARLWISWRPRLLGALSWTAAPLLIPISGLDALLRRRSILRSLLGAVGKFHKMLAQWSDFDVEPLYYTQLGQVFRRRPPDVVHVHGWGCGDDPPGGLKWLRRRGYPLVYTEHNSPDPAIHAEIEAAPMNLADVLIAVSEAGRQGLLKVGRASRPIVVIPYSVEPLSSLENRPPTADRRPPKESSLSVSSRLGLSDSSANGQPSLSGREFTITCVARLGPQKGHVDLLNAMTRVVREVPGAQLLLAGQGSLRNELEAQVQRLCLQDHVRFLGIVTRQELLDLLAQTDVVTLPSYWEGLPVALIEALSAGKALVVTNVGGNPELVTDGENGLVVPPRDPETLAAALIRLAREDDLRRKMGQASRRRFETGGFSPTTVTDNTLAAYQLAQNDAEKYKKNL